MNDTNHFGLSMLDLVALFWFIASWTGYVIYTRRCNLKHQRGLLAAMNRMRDRWAEALLKRENRIVDSQVLNGLIHKESFFASTTLLILASTVALLGVGDKANQLFSAIPFARETPLALWELKVVVLALIFIYSFFKFTWSIRQHSYCAIVLAAIPSPEHAIKQDGTRQVRRLTHLSNLAARHFNDGLRGYYFALAELSWFFHPGAFIAATAWVIVVLYRREFHSRALEILQ